MNRLCFSQRLPQHCFRVRNNMSDRTYRILLDPREAVLLLVGRLAVQKANQLAAA